MNENLGYNQSFETNRIQLGFADFVPARVLAEFKNAYTVKNETGEYLATITGKQVFHAASREAFPAVGDWVVIIPLDDHRAVIHGILPRQTIIKRKFGDKNKSGTKDDVQVIAANIDVAFVVESVDRDYNLNRFERYFALAKTGGVTPAIILNKIDLLSVADRARRMAELKKRFPDTDIIFTSTVKDVGLAELKKHILPGKTFCFLGSSGVGKSSLINALLGESTIKTGDISSYSGRGKHVTTVRQMYFLKCGGIVIDNPGMRAVDVADAVSGVDATFDEITALAAACKYADCSHMHEPGCNVLRALTAGELDEEKYSNYINLKKEIEYYELNDFEKREKDRQFGKFLKKTKKELKALGNKNL